MGKKQMFISIDLFIISIILLIFKFTTAGTIILSTSIILYALSDIITILEKKEKQ